MNMGSFLIGVGVGSLMITGINYAEKRHQGIIPTPYILAIGILSLLTGIILEIL